MRLQSWLANLFQQIIRPQSPAKRPRNRKSQFFGSHLVESLESRQLLSAGAVAVGTETRINTATAGAQMSPVVAMDNNGNYVIAWASNGQDGSAYGIYAQRFNASGVAQGSEFKVNTYTTGSQSNPAIAMDAAGDFVITWDSQKQDKNDTGGYGVYAQRYNAAGVAQGAEFRVNTYTTDAQEFPSIAMDDAGEFVIAWESEEQDGVGLTGVHAQRYNAAGVAQGAEFKVNANTTEGNPGAPQIAMDATGNFVVAWSSYTSIAAHIYAQRFAASGAKQGSEFKPSNSAATDQVSPSVAMNDSGAFVVAWTEAPSAAPDTTQIFAQRYNAAGTAQGTPFRVNTYTKTLLDNPAVAIDAAGDFLVGWNSYDQDGSYYGVYAQRFLAAGTAQGTEFKVNTYTLGVQNVPAIANDPAGDLVVTWQSYPQDGSDYGVYAQRYKPPAAAMNHAPAGAAKTVTTLEDTAYVFKTTDFGFTDPGDSPANTLLAVKITTLPTAGSLTNNGIAVTAGMKVSAADITAGKLKFSPLANKNGAAYSKFTIQVQDNGGTANGGIDTDPTARTMTIAVTSVNDAPSGTAKTVTTFEDVAYVFKATDFGFTDPNDVPANTLLAVKISTLPTAGTVTNNGFAVAIGTKVSAADIAAGKLKFVPGANKSGVAYSSFTFQVQDNGGTTNGGIDTDATARKMTINVTAVNDAPVGSAKTVTMLEDTAYVFKVTDFGFTDPIDVPANAFLAVRITTLPLAGSLTNNGLAIIAGAHISVADIAAGKLKFTPAANKSGAAYASFTFQVQDNGGTANGGVDTDLTARKMTIAVTAVNDPPVGAAKTVSMLKNTAYLFKVTDFGFADSSDTPPNTLLSVKISTLPTLGSLTNNGVAVMGGALISIADITTGKLKFTPATNGTGAAYASFTFQVKDNGGTASGGVDLDLIARKMTISVI